MHLAEKYKPKKIKEVVGQQEAISALLGWFLHWKRRRGLIISGPPGTGKTATVRALAAENGMELVEIGPEDFVEELLPTIRQRGLLMKRKIIVVEGAELFKGVELQKILDSSVFPVVLMADDPWKPAVRQVRGACDILGFRKIPRFAIEGRLAEVAKQENIRPETPVASFAALADGDMRAALIDLDSGLAARDRSSNVFETLRAIFRGPYITAAAAIESCDKDPAALMWWVEENIPQEFRGAGERAAAFELLSRFNVAKHRSRNSAELLSSFCSLPGKRPGFVSYRPPRPQFPPDDELCAQLAAETHCSKRKIRKELPIIRKIIAVN